MAQLNTGGASASRLAAGSRNAANAAARGRGGLSGNVPIIMDQDVVCCVRLQLLLYFAFWYDLLFAAIHVVTAWYKWRWMKGVAIMVFSILNFILCFVVEPARLYIGYAGNLGEKVPQLLLFNFFCLVPCIAWFATELILVDILPELEPRRCSMIPGRSCVLPVEKACWWVQIGMLFAQLLLGIRALRSVIREKSARFFRSLTVGQPDGSIIEQVPLLGSGSAQAGNAAGAARGQDASQTSLAASSQPTANLIGRGSYSPLRGDVAQRHSHVD